MPLPRFFVDAGLAPGTTVELPAAVAHHAVNVLRLRAGAPLVLFNGRGGEYRAHLAAVRPAAAALESFDPVERESPLAVTLVQALVAADKLDWIVEKCTELGVARLLIAPAQRSTVRLGSDRLASRLARWRDLVVAACAQCGRNRPPTVLHAATMQEALAQGADSVLRLLCAPAAAQGLNVPPGVTSVTVAIGPEGDWTDAELAAATELDYHPARFGPRVLRTETAGLAVIAALQVAAGDLSLRTA